MRLMVAFEKGPEIRFIGHLDLMRTMQRALRRSGLPLSFSKGFNPHIRLSFAVPLSVGVVGVNELMDVPLEECIPCEQFIEKLNAVLPDCMKVHSCKEIPEEYPALMSLVAGADYRIVFGKNEDGKKLADHFNAFVSQESCIALRRTKSGENDCDIFQFVVSVSLEEKEENYEVMLKTLSNQGGMLKPSLWFETFCEFCGLQDVPYMSYRTHILGRDTKGNLLPMEDLA